MGLRGGGFWSRSTFAAAGALALSACASGPSGTLYDLSAARPPPAHAVGAQFRVGQPTATADLDSDHFLVREFADAGHSCWRSLAAAAACAFPRAARAEFPERWACPLDRRPGGKRQLRSRSRHPRLRARRPVEGSQCRHRRLDRLAWQRADRGGPDFHSADAGRINRSSGRGGGDGSGGFDRHDRDRRIRRQEALTLTVRFRACAQALELNARAASCA